MHAREPFGALSLVLRSVDAIRNARALYVLTGTFAVAGLLLATAESSLARDAGWWGPAQAGAAFFVAFYGGNAAGLLVMDDARGVVIREIHDAFRVSLLTAHRLILVLLVVSGAYALLGALLLAVFWLSRTSVTGAVAGPLIFGFAVPLGVVAIGLAALAGTAVVVPMAAPAIWCGAGVLATARSLRHLVRHRLLMVAFLMAAVSLLTAATGAIIAFVVQVGGRGVAELGVRVVGVDVPRQELTAGLFGYGLRSLGASGAPTGSTGHAAAALVGGGVVFALALLLPGLVYLRGTCSVYLAMRDEPTVSTPAPGERADRAS